jgi:peroxiredoxin
VLPQFQSLHASLVVITPQLESYGKAMRAKLNLSFDILSDRGNQVASQFGLSFALPEDLKAVYKKFGLDLAHFNGDDSWTLPMPARFIIDRQSIVRYAAADPDYTVRPEPEDTVKVLRQLAASASVPGST